MARWWGHGNGVLARRQVVEVVTAPGIRNFLERSLGPSQRNLNATHARIAASRTSITIAIEKDRSPYLAFHVRGEGRGRAHGIGEGEKKDGDDGM
jgi:hypothetical protein